jgi:lactate racemase
LELKLPYCGTWLNFDLPVPKKNILVLHKKDPTPAKSTEDLTAEALANPIGKQRLSRLVKPGNKVTVLFDDWTRPTPVGKIIPVVLEELRKGGVSEEDILLVCGNGTHAPAYMTEERLIEKLGETIFRRFKVISHDAYDYSKLKYLGETKRLTTPLFLNKWVAEADFKITIGRIAPHGDVGYSGGSKMIMPGVSSIWNIIHHHTGSFPYKGILHNPLREDIEECGRMAGLDFIVNVVTNSGDEVTRVFAGNPLRAHRSGVEYGDRSVWGAKIGGLADIVIASPGPLNDEYFMGAMRSLGVALRAVKESGTIIVVAACSKGWSKGELLDLGWHPTPDLLEYDYPGLLRLVMSRAWHEPNRQFQALVYYVHHIARTCIMYDVCTAGATGFRKRDAEKLRMKYYDSVEDALKDALKKHGREAKVTVIPDYFILPLTHIHRAS